MIIMVKGNYKKGSVTMKKCWKKNLTKLALEGGEDRKVRMRVDDIGI